jgi:hypothetical protein
MPNNPAKRRLSFSSASKASQPSEAIFELFICFDAKQPSEATFELFISFESQAPPAKRSSSFHQLRMPVIFSADIFKKHPVAGQAHNEEPLAITNLFYPPKNQASAFTNGPEVRALFNPQILLEWHFELLMSESFYWNSQFQ